MRPFLTARWESLLLLNYACPRDRLDPLVPAGTTLDLWQGEALVSVVGFLFRDTRLLGLPIPFHRHFEEVNLRFCHQCRWSREGLKGSEHEREGREHGSTGLSGSLCRICG